MESGWEQWRIAPLKSLVLPAGLTLIAVLEGTPALANPSGAEVIHGSATFEHAGSVLSVTNTDGAIIEWQSFNIGTDESTRFNQPSSSSRVLNRVLGSDPTSILGNLTSNGKVFLINPSGILVGEGARIDVGSLVASTLDISNEDFLSRNYQFDAGQQTGSVINDGVIISGEGGSIYLLANDVTNSGIIASPEGELLLAAGHSIKIGNTTTPGVSAEITAPAGTVLNLGELLAQQGAISAVAGQLDNQGVINADGLVSDGGKVYLRASESMQLAGAISADGIRGGQIDATAPDMTLAEGSITADGAQGGGRIRLGGEYQGGKHLEVDELPNAQQLLMEEGSFVSARGMDSQSNGGQVVVWADQQTLAAGTIEATGGELGTGGKIEVSGAEQLVFRGEVRAGRGGEVLFDPKDIVIEFGSPFGAGTHFFTDDPGSTHTLDPNDVTVILDAGTDLILQANNDIKVEDVINADASGAGGKLTLQAGRSVFINANIDTDGGGLAIGANEPLAAGVQDAHRDPGLAMITMAASTSISTVGSGSGDIDIKIHDGAGLTNSGAGAITLEQITGGQIVVQNKGADGDIALNNKLNATGDIIIDAGAGDFFNNDGGGVFNLTGRWLVYSTDPALNTLGGLDPGFKQYNATSASTLASTGDGLIYSIAPMITPQLTGTVNKTYDGNTSITLAAGNITFTGAIDGDDVGLNAPTGSSFAAKNVGTTLVNATGFSLSGASYEIPDGPTIPVFGYQLSTTNASGNIGSISRRSLTPNATGVDKTYDGGTAASVNFTDNRIAGDSLSFSHVSVFTDANVGKNIPVNVLSISLGGTDGGNYTLTKTTDTTSADILAAVVSPVSLVASDKIYDSTTAVSLTAASLAGVVSGDSVSLNLDGNFLTADAGTNKSVATNLSLSGADSSNYVLSNSSPTLFADITPATLSLSSVLANDKVYDGDADATLTLGSLQGVLAGDAVTASGAGSFDDKNVGTNKAVTTNLLLSGTDAGNYQLDESSPLLSADITAASLSVALVNAMDKEYDGDVAAEVDIVGFSGVLSGDDVDVVADASFSSASAGLNKAVSANLSLSGADAGNYQLNQTVFGDTADITARSISLDSISAADKTYDGTTDAQVTAGDLSGIVAGDAVTAELTGNFDTKQVGVNKTVSATATLTGADSGNYQLDNPAQLATADITPATLDVAGIIANNKVYDGNTDAVATVDGLTGVVDGDDVSVGLVASFDSSAVGVDKTVSATLSLGGADSGNYQLTQTLFNDLADITALGISLESILASDKVYDGGVAADVTAGNLLGVLDGDEVGVDLVGSFDAKQVSDNRTVTASLSLTGADSGNYALLEDSLETTAAITPLSISLEAIDAQNKVYDGDVSAQVTPGNLLGVIDGDNVTVDAEGSFDNSDVGQDKSVTANLALSGADSGNYLLDNPVVLGNADITPATLSLSDVAVSDKVYDGNTDASATPGALAGIIGDDVVSVNVAAQFIDADAGNNKQVTVDALLDGADAANYELQQSQLLSSASITPATVTLSGVDALDKIYDGTTTAQAGGGSLAGVIGGDNVLFSIAGDFADKNVGDGIDVTLQATLTGTDAGNYQLAQDILMSNADITPATLGLTGLQLQDKIYDGTTVAQDSGAALVGVVAGDDVDVNTESGFADKNVGQNIGVTTSLMLTGADQGNYQLANTTVEGQANINPATLNLNNVTASDKVYDGGVTATAMGDELQGVIGADVVSAGFLANFEDKNVGDDKVVNVEASLKGSDAGNYALNEQQFVVSASITPADVTLTGISTVDKTYDGGVEAQVEADQLEGVIEGDDLTVQFTASFDTRDVGENKAVMAIASLAGTDVGNYSLTNPHQGGQATITPATVTVSEFSATNRVYDGSTDIEVQLGTVDGVIEGDDVQFGAAGALADKNVGEDQQVSLQLTLNGADAGNYIVTTDLPTATATVSAAGLSLTSVDAEDRVFNGGVDATLILGDLTGLVEGDDVQISGTGTFASPDIGTNKPVSALFSLSGTDVNNYVFTSPDDPFASITALEALSWIGASEGNWSDPANWQNGVIPTATNVLNLSLPAGITVNYDLPDLTVLETITGGGSLRMSQGSLTLGTSVQHQSQLALLDISGGSFFGTGELQGNVVLNSGSLNGNNWTLVGNLEHLGGVLSPGASPGSLSVDGDYLMEAGAVLRMELAGTAPGTEYDVLNVSGRVDLDGTLQITHLNEFNPVDNSIYPGLIRSNGLLTGSFASIQQPEGIDYQRLLSQAGLDLAFGVPVIEVVTDVDVPLIHDVDAILVDEGILVGTSLFNIHIINSLDDDGGGDGGSGENVGGNSGHFGGATTTPESEGGDQPNDC
ncbi:filamentous hemagglutinin N-terminal domain-containing protein [Pseudomaricurvus alkylphenolicus]|uniref:YDG domain-containing protein n=1 Tax=Pseudomaricurvus alkylphenolicus TaxID=1306991 RepID=UPI00141D9232|nr:YDG domain-containing protein [Pseudomaricurvus alkylphenolicus]NIB42926.1 filamentous hemagglutinin N-terminal domain-containing protein [Pseudomaricurvus alkylphenolicus]